jgi:hypothetical protein
MKRLTLVATLLLLSTAACGDASARSNTIVADSAGVQIVTSMGPSWDEGERWIVDSEPLLDIGGNESDPHYDLFRVARAPRLSDGRVAVLNGGTSEVRYYDSTGTWLRSVGREGQGPGEFESTSGLYRLPGDTLLVYDINLRRMSRLAPDGSFLPSISMAEAGGGMPIRPIGQLADGSWAATGVNFFTMETQSGVTRPPLQLLHVASDLNQVTDTIAVLPGSQGWVETGTDESRRFMSVRSLPFGLSSPYAAGDSLIYAGDAAQFVIGVYRPDGTLVRSIRYQVPRTPVTAEVIERLKADELSRIPESNRADHKAQWERMPMAELLPAFSAFTVDAGGNLWVIGPRVLPSDPASADVFSPDGKLLGQVDLPAGVSPYEIGRDYLLGVWKDEMELEHVRMYRIVQGR